VAKVTRRCDWRIGDLIEALNGAQIAPTFPADEVA